MAVPKLRFPGFTDDWEQRKLGEICQVTMGQSPDGATYSDVPSDYILVQGNADLKNGWVFPRVWTTQKTKTAEVGDLIMSVRAPAGAMGKTNYNVVLGRGVAGIKGNEFIYQTLVKMDEDGYWKKLAAGSTFESINSDVISNAEIAVPQDVDEQEKLGDYFRNLDHLITLHQCECNELQELKKSMLQKMFPKAGKTVPEIRFPGFDGEWERIPLRNVTTQSLDKNSKNQHIPVYSVTNHSGFIPQEDTFVNGEVASQNKKTYRIVKKNQFAYNPTRINVGSIDYLRDIEKVIVSPLYVVFMCNDNVDPAFIKLFSLTNDFKNQRQDNTEVGVRDTLKYDRFSNILISLPSLKEQQKIGSFFKEIDNRIELQKQLLDEIKEYKKGLLQQMFC